MSLSPSPATPRSRWYRICNRIECDSPTRPGEFCTPKDYPFDGYFSAPGGPTANVRSIDMPYREMVETTLCGVSHKSKRLFDEKPSLEELVAEVPAKCIRYHDPYDHEQGDPKPFEAVFRAHVLRLVKGWKHEQSLHLYLKHKPFLTTDLGFEDIPDQSTLWRAWDDRLREVREAVAEAAEVVVEVAREWDIPAPDPGFLPEKNGYDDPDEDEKEALAEEKAQQVWRQAKPFVTDCFELQRADNASIPESAFWEQQAFMSMREEMYANDGATNFAVESTRGINPSGDSHRYQLKKLGVPDVRQMLRDTTETMIERARSRHQLDGNVIASIDITKGHPWTGQVQRDSDGDLQEPWILGYKDNDVYFQWAVIKIVGDDTPFFLDAVPVVRGRDRGDIVDDLLEGALSILPNIELVMMDREFDGEAVKQACERHDVCYLNPARIWKNDTHAKQIKQMNDEDRDFDVAVQRQFGDRNDRKALYLPKREYEKHADNSDGEDGDTERADQHRQQMLSEASEKLGLEDGSLSERDTEELSPFEELVAEVADEEELSSPEEFEPPTMAFETNHPLIEADTEDEQEMAHQIGRMMLRYKRRWGIENGFKKIKSFLCRTTSKDHQYRYFCFAFSCVLYNCWRIVDLLVQLSIRDEPEHSPEITANLFLTLAKDYYGLDPPD